MSQIEAAAKEMRDQGECEQWFAAAEADDVIRKVRTCLAPGWSFVSLSLCTFACGRVGRRRGAWSDHGVFGGRHAIPRQALPGNVSHGGQILWGAPALWKWAACRATGRFRPFAGQNGLLREEPEGKAMWGGLRTTCLCARVHVVAGVGEAKGRSA